MKRALIGLRSDLGQATAEYALVLLAAAAVAIAFIVWVSGSDALPRLFTTVIDKVTGAARGAGIG